MARAFRFRQRRPLRPAHEHQRGAPALGQRRYGAFVNSPLPPHTRQRAEARITRPAARQKAGPGAGQRQQTQRMSGWRGVENDMIKIRRGGGFTQPSGKFIERGNLRRASAGKLFFHAPQDGGGQLPAVRPDHFLTIRRRRQRRIDVQRGEPRHVRNIGGGGSQIDSQHFIQIRGRVGADQQHAPPAVGQHNGRRARQRGLTHAALAGEKKKAGRRFHQARQRLFGADAHAVQHKPPQPQPDFAGAGGAVAFNLKHAANSLRPG